MLARALRPDDRGGFWVDVGAGDPVVDSVTAAFAERGWRGVNVEPLPREHERLCAARPADTNLRVALGATAGLGTLFVEPAENRGASTMVPELAERYRADGEEFTPIEVPISTHARVVADHVAGPVDFLKVDVEGLEREVLAGADWSSFRPRVVVMEATVPKSDEPAHEGWEPMLLEVGYRFAMFDGLNRFYAHADEPKLVQRLAIPANVFDDFVPFAWAHQVDQAQQWAHSLEDALTQAQQERDELYESLARASATARSAQEHSAIADERNALLRDDLNAAQLRTARALAETHARPRAPRMSEMTDSDDQLRHLLDRGYELAASHLEGINEAALELADAAGDDRRVMERAFRVVAERVRLDPSHANNQVASLIRRAIELGMWRWDWDNTRPVP